MGRWPVLRSVGVPAHIIDRSRIESALDWIIREEGCHAAAYQLRLQCRIVGAFAALNQVCPGQRLRLTSHSPHRVLDASDRLGRHAAHDVPLGHVASDHGAGCHDCSWPDRHTGHDDCAMSDEYVVADVDLADPIQFDVEGAIEDFDRPIVSDEVARCQEHVVSDPDIGWVADGGPEGDTHVLAHAMDAAVTLQIEGVVLWREPAHSPVQPERLAVVERKCAQPRRQDSLDHAMFYSFTGRVFKMQARGVAPARV